MPTRTIYLIRHGQYTHDDSDPHEGSLTALGKRQAKRLAHRLRGLPIRAIHCSTLRRAEETARILAAEFPNLDVQPASILQECVPGLPALFGEYFAEKYPADLLDGGQRQAETAFRRYFRRAHNEERHELIVCHGNIIRYLVCRAIDAPTDHWTNLDVRNAGLCEISIESNGRTTLLAFNDTGHLPASMLTFV